MMALLCMLMGLVFSFLDITKDPSFGLEFALVPVRGA
jgi:hypothetical protein